MAEAVAAKQLAKVAEKKMSKIVLKSLSILLGAFFIFLGVLKISPKISKDLHKDLRTEYAKYAKVFPLAKMLDFKVPSKWYRRTVGGLEIVSGMIMMILPSRSAKNVANILLLVMKTLNVYSHWAISDEFERTAPTLVFLLMLSCRMVVDWQLARKPAGGDHEKQLDPQAANTNANAAITNKKTN